MKIEVRRRTPDSKTPRIAIREKTIYVCKRCGNHYYSYHFFCPQCLGEVENSSPQFSMLRISSLSSDDANESQLLFERLSGIEGFDFTGALKKLPWICMKQSDPGLLRIWKECLEAAGFHADILATLPPAKARKRKEHPPLFVQNAPYPQFLPPALTQDIRALGSALPPASLKLAWAETASAAVNLLERIYKKQSERVLFIDYIYQIEESLREFTATLSAGKISDESFIRQTNKLMGFYRQMESEMDSVREQVQKQL